MIKSGDTILVLATARCINSQEVEPFLKWAATKGLNVELAPNLFEVEHQFAGSDLQRAEDLLWALSHPSATAVFCARGGYGTLRTVKKLESILLDSKQIDTNNLQFQSSWKQKLFIGFSDVTVLHSWLNSNHWISLHGPVVAQWSNENFTDTLLSLERAIFDGEVTIKIDGHSDVPSFTGKLVGGNLSLIYALLGTKYRLQTENAVLLIEDLDEYLYHIDRMMQSLECSGILSNIRALLVGGLSKMNDNQIPFGKSAQEIIKEITDKYQFPVIFDVPIGHLSTNNSVFLGTSVTFDGNQLSQSIETTCNV